MKPYQLWVVASVLLVVLGCEDSQSPGGDPSERCAPGDASCQDAMVCTEDVDDSVGCVPIMDARSGEMDSGPSTMTDAIVDSEPPPSDVAQLVVDEGPLDQGVDTDAARADGSLPVCQKDFENGPIVRDVAYGASERQVLDLYQTAAPGPVPLLIWIHGGGWRGGTKNQVNRIFLSFRQRGYAIASIEYRLSDTPWPATVIDVKSAVRFLRARSAEFNIDPDRFIAMGSSAGGHLVSMLGTSADHPLFIGPDPMYPEVSDQVQAVVNFYGPTDMDEMDNDASANGCPDNALCHDCEGSPESMLLDCRPSLCVERADEASPVNYANIDSARFLTFHGQDDCTVPTPQGRRLHDALQAAGATSELVEVPGAGHNVNACLSQGNGERMFAFAERVIRGCQDGNNDVNDPNIPEDSQIGECLWRRCAELAAACHTNPPCVALELCFQDCFSRSLGRCINRCLAMVADAQNGRADHEALYRCAQPAGCYGPGQ